MKIHGTWCLLVMLLSSSLRASPPPVVVVFDLEAQGIGLSEDLRGQLTDYLASLIAERGFQVVPRSQLLERLRQKKKESHSHCYDQSCQIELGRELAAQKTAVSRVLAIGQSCKLSLTLLDLKTAASEAAVNLDGGCKPEDLVALLERSVDKIAGRDSKRIELPVLSDIQPLRIEPGSAIQTDLDPDLLAAYEKALALDKQSKEKPKQAANAWAQLAGMPEPNPYRDLARRRSELLWNHARQKTEFENRHAQDRQKLASLLSLKLIDLDEKHRLVDQYLDRYGKHVRPDTLLSVLEQAPEQHAAELEERYLKRESLQAMCRSGNQYACEKAFDHRLGWHLAAGLSITAGESENTDEGGLLQLEFGYRWRPVRILFQGNYMRLPTGRYEKSTVFMTQGACDLVLDANDVEAFLRGGVGWATMDSDPDGWSHHLVFHVQAGFMATSPRSLGLGLGAVGGVFFGTGDFFGWHIGALLSYAFGS